MSIISDLRDTDFNDLGSAPTSSKVVLLLLLAALIIGLGYWFKVKDQRERLASLERTEQQLKTDFENKQEKANNLPAYEEQLAEMEAMLVEMRRQLPSRTEMPGLLDNISQAAIASGIETELFEPGSERLQDFFAERPINIRMIGNYHQFGSFASRVAELERVVVLNLRDLESHQSSTHPGGLKLEGVISTYRYLEEEELDAQAEAQGGAQ